MNFGKAIEEMKAVRKSQDRDGTAKDSTSNLQAISVM